MQKITPFLWFDGQAEEAATLYVSLFKRSKITSVVRNPGAAPGPAGGVMVVAFELDGQKFTALNGGPEPKFTAAISLVANCEDQAEVDMLWAKLSEGGETSRCGWLKDRFGLSWQVVPVVLPELLMGADRAGSGRAMQAMMGMTKLDIAALRQAYAG